MAELYGYARVSTQAQNEERQLIKMEMCGIQKKNIFVDKKSGKNFDRPEYIKMVKKLKKGDTVYILSIDRLGRNMQEILKQWTILTQEKGVGMVVMDMPALNVPADEKDIMRKLISDIILRVMSCFAEIEYNNIRERAAQGRAAAMAKGTKFGRPRMELPKEFDYAYEKWRKKEYTLKEGAGYCGLTYSTFRSRAIERLEAENTEEITEENDG